MPTAAAALVALIPAALVWWSGRRHIQLVHDPALPERLVADGRRRSIASAVAIAVLIVFWNRHVVWTVPLMLGAATAATYPLRRVLFGETWSFWTYLAFFGRLYLAVLGFWFVVALAPAIAVNAGALSSIAAAALAAVLIAWHFAYADVLRRLLAAAPIGDTTLRSAYARMADECRLGSPALEQVRVPGGVVANAIALASPRRSSVMFTDTLLERLTPEEAEAICAHEVAHLEYYDRARLRREAVFNISLIAGGFVATLLARTSEFWESIIPMLWAAVVLAALGWRARTRQANETASDLRAVALTGNPEALISALSKLHEIGRLPRRFDPALERQLTHPSLARRIQAIRAAAGCGPTVLNAPVTFTAPGPDASVTFDAARLTWTEGAGITHSVSYDHLVELRVAARSAGTALVVVDTTARRWEIPLAAEDVLRAQAVLDVVDTRLAKPSATDPRRPAGVRASLAIASIAAAAAAQWTALIVAIVAIVKPAPRLLASTAAAAGAAGFLAWSADAVPLDPRPWIGLAMLAVAPVLAAAARRGARQEAADTAWHATAFMTALLAAVWMLTLAGAGRLDALSLSHSVRMRPGASVLSIAVGVALAWRRAGAIRYAGATLAGIGVAVGFVGSRFFVDRFVHDPLLVPARPIAVAVITDPPFAEFDAPPGTHGVLLSPDASHVAFASTIGDRRPTLHVGPTGGELTRFEADEALFVGDGRAVLLAYARGVAVVSELTLAGSQAEVASEHRVPGMAGARLSAEADGRWQLIGWTSDDEVVAVESDGAGGLLPERRWSHPEGADFLTPLTAAGDESIVLERRYDLMTAGLAPAWWLRLMPLMTTMPGPNARLWLATHGGRRELVSSRLDAECPGASVSRTSPARPSPVCTVFDGTRTRFVAIASAAPVDGLFHADGRFFDQGRTSRGWMTGWWRGKATALRLETAQAIQIEGDGIRPYQLAPSDGIIGALFHDSGRPTFRLYRIAPTSEPPS